MIANSGKDENGKYSGGAAGDQTGGEWSIINWYNRPWNCVLRYPDKSVGALIAELAREAANNNKIGYDQNQRRTFYNQLKSVGWFPKDITTACESDCSAGATAITIAAGNILGLDKLKALSPDIYTGNMRSAFQSAGFSVLTDSKYLTSDQYLQPGDVLLYEGHHTAVNLDWGNKTTMPTVTPTQIINAVAAVYRTAHNGRYRYGDSHGNPPTSDGVISCDRGIAKGLYDLGFKDQPRGDANHSSGITVINMESYLLKWGFKKITDQNQVQAGDIVLMKANGTSAPTAAWHTYLVTAVTKSGNTITINKYDFGSQERINSAQPFVGTPINQWPGSRTFYAIFRANGASGGGSKDYVFTPQVVKRGATGASQYMANVICKARDCKGIKGDDGKLKDIELNGQWTIGDMAAMAEIKLGRIRAGYNDMATGAGAGEISTTDWTILLGSTLPFHCVPLPAKQTNGVCVLLWQEHLRANGFKGADGNLIRLDRQWGANCEYATKAWQKSVGRPQTGKVEYDDWKIAFKNI